MLKNFFYLQRNDRQALIAILGVIVLSLSLIAIIGHNPINSSENQLATDSSSFKKASKKAPLYYKVSNSVHELFPFDPNTADSTDLLRLGLSPWQVRNIYHYRAKGGIYRTANDFAQLYGLTKKQFEVLLPFIKISEDYQPASMFYGNNKPNKKPSHKYISYTKSNENKDSQISTIYHHQEKLHLGQQVAINTADTTLLKQIPGIGTYYAKMIVRYRGRLGGFYSPQQLLEIEGFPESALPYILVTPEDIRKLEINHMSLRQLRQHPYINFYQAKEICDYIRLNGPLKNLQELKLLKDFPSAEIDRLAPYVKF